MLKLTNDEILREIEIDIEAVIFNINLDEQNAELWPDVYEELPDYRKADRDHLNRAKKLIAELRKQI